jgi:MoaA/NifB/PqqE/SkfB family radical SAM enzyme
MEKNNNFFNKDRGVNIDLCNRCPLECPRCRRQTAFKNHGLSVPGNDISLENFKKVIKFFNSINLEGTLSDPVHHKSFIQILKMCYVAKKELEIHNGSSAKSKEWYIEAFKANPYAYWKFSIDGLPEESKKYRINQDGSKLFDIMVESKKYLFNKPTWQYIVFSYNENNIDAAIALAKKVGVEFYILNSSQWIGNDDWLIPSKSEYGIKQKYE